MTLAEAAMHIGDAVIRSQNRQHYCDLCDRSERGVITSVNSRYVFVRYPGGVKATRAEELTLVSTPAGAA